MSLCIKSVFSFIPAVPLTVSQIDFLEHPAIEDVIIPSIVLQEVRHRNRSVYDRLRTLTDESSNRRFYVFQNEHHRNTYITHQSGESDNDRNDRAIRVAAKWYADLLGGKMNVVLLTNDVNNRFKAQRELGLIAKSVVEYAKSRTDCKELYDIAQIWAQDSEMEIDDHEIHDNSKKQCRRGFYTEHKPMSELNIGIQQGLYHQGTLEMSRNSWYCGTVESDFIIKIVGVKQMNRAVSGDVVAVKLLETTSGVHLGSESDDEDDAEGAVQSTSTELGTIAIGESGAVVKYPLGEVVGIIKRNWKSTGYCGSIKESSSKAQRAVGYFSRVVFHPKTRSFPPIVIRTAQVQELIGKRIVVAIDSWPADSRLPLGHYIKKLGEIGHKTTETEVLLLENEINTNPFTPAVHACVPPLPWTVPTGDLEDPDRTDFQNLCIFSIDPPDCKDIDDALHFRFVSSEECEIGVHIADVTHFLLPNTPLDLEASKRSTTVYLVEKAISMLPRALTEEICSLKSGVERLAFSIVWRMTPDGEFIENQPPMFTKSVIKSRASLSYSEAQARIDDERLQDELTCNLRHLNILCKILRNKRRKLGALELASSEVKFQLDSETQDPTDVAIYQTLDTNRLVEEMMLLANNTVAKKILNSFPNSACLRRHPSPNPKRFESIVAALETKGLTLDLTTNKSLGESLNQATASNDPYFNTLLRMMITRCMKEAEYFVSGEHLVTDYYHYGLAMELYTHFTSPIRRYADVLVHRLLSAALGLTPMQECFSNSEYMKDLIRNLNIRHKNAQLASRASASLYTLVYFRNKKVRAEGRVTGFTGIKRLGMNVYIQKYGIEGPVFTSSSSSEAQMNKTGSFVLKNSTELESSETQKTYCIFDKVIVEIEVKGRDDRNEELVLALVEEEEEF
eukprot:g5203.t1